MTPAEVADLLTEHVTDVDAVAAERYPHNPTARREDVVAKLRLLVETAAEHLRQFELERERHIEEITRLKTKAEVLETGHAAAAANYERRCAHV